MNKPLKRLLMTCFFALALPLFTGNAYAEGAGATPPAYFIAEFVIHDPDTIKPYSQHVPDTLRQYGGEFSVRRGNIVNLEGEPVEGGIVVIKFPSMKKAMAWYQSPEYSALRPLRLQSATTRVYVVEGLTE